MSPQQRRDSAPVIQRLLTRLRLRLQLQAILRTPLAQRVFHGGPFELEPMRKLIRSFEQHNEPRKLLEELQGLGATNADQTRERGLTGKSHYRRMLAAYETMRVDGRIPATWEVISAHAWGPPAGQPRRVDGGEIASFSIDSLRGSRR
jgi:hypothetical protein